MKFDDISIGVPIYASDFGDFFIPVQKFADASYSGICFTLSSIDLLYIVYNDDQNIDSNDASGAFMPATENDFVKVSDRLAGESIYYIIIERIFKYKKV